MTSATSPTPGEPASTPEPAPANASSNPSNAVIPPADARLADPEDSTPTEKTSSLMGRVQEWRKKNELVEIAAFFFIGFIYDVVTLSRIDDTFTMVQQFVYLVVLATLLLLEQRHPEGTEPPKALAKVWKWREDAIHFFYGSLLSSYTLFFFKSASGLTAFVFLLLMFGLMVANELPIFRQLGPVVRVALFSLCVSMYFSYVVPVIIGKANFWVFLLAQVVAGGVIYGVIHLLRRWNILDQVQALRQIAIPGFGVLAALLLFYVVRVMPPVPLAVTFSGVYHGVKKEGGAYHLSHEAKWWKPWQKGDQDFLARPGDKAYYFFSIFAPKGFDWYTVNVRWYYDHPDKGWTLVSTVPLTIRNKGIERGYRSYAYNSNPKPGDWRVVLETADGHEISRLSFTVEPDTRTEPRQFEIFVHDPDKRPDKAGARPADKPEPAPQDMPQAVPQAVPQAQQQP